MNPFLLMILLCIAAGIAAYVALSLIESHKQGGNQS